MTALCTSLAVGTALACGLWDYRTGRIPNVLTIGSLFGALVVQWLGRGGMGLSHSALGAAGVGFAPLLVFVFTKGQGIGGGDVKALAALGAWFGVDRGMQVALCSLVLCCAMAIWSEARAGNLRALVAGIVNRSQASPRVWRLGPFMAAASVCAVPAMLLEGAFG